MEHEYIKGLVSIVTPCYNTGALLHRLFDSILEQDYPHIEMYAINDGSTDNTEEVIKSYIPKFKERGYSLECMTQPNGGQSSALNNGLKCIKGEFFVWPDSDDYFSSPQSISQYVDILSSDEGIAVVRCLPTYIDEATLTPIKTLEWNDVYKSYDQFLNCLYSENFFWGAGDYMIRMEAFDKANPEREIYVEKKAGQNWQILLPALYNKKCKTLKESLFCILERTGSHCRADGDSFEKQLDRFACYDRTIITTLERMSISIEEKKAYLKKVARLSHQRDLLLAIRFRNRTNVWKFLCSSPYSMTRKDWLIRMKAIIFLLSNN